MLKEALPLKNGFIFFYEWTLHQDNVGNVGQYLTHEQIMVFAQGTAQGYVLSVDIKNAVLKWFNARADSYCYRNTIKRTTLDLYDSEPEPLHAQIVGPVTAY